MSDNVLPILELNELVEIFGYVNERAAKRALRDGTFPVPVFTLAGRPVAHVDAVDLYMNEQRQASMTWLKAKYGITEKDVHEKTEPRLDKYRRASLRSHLEEAES